MAMSAAFTILPNGLWECSLIDVVSFYRMCYCDKKLGLGGGMLGGVGMNMKISTVTYHNDVVLINNCKFNGILNHLPRRNIINSDNIHQLPVDHLLDPHSKTSDFWAVGCTITSEGVVGHGRSVGSVPNCSTILRCCVIVKRTTRNLICSLFEIISVDIDRATVDSKII